LFAAVFSSESPVACSLLVSLTTAVLPTGHFDGAAPRRLHHTHRLFAVG
jgi:hypothetical protein